MRIAIRIVFAFVVCGLIAGCSRAASRPADTPTPARTPSNRLLVYMQRGTQVIAKDDRSLPTWSIVTYDPATQRQLSSFVVGDPDTHEAASQAVLAGGRVVVNFEQKLVSYALDGSDPRDLFVSLPGFIISISASPDGSKIAFAYVDGTKCPETPHWCLSTDATFIYVIDATTGAELLRVPQSDPGFDGYFGQAALITWRDDGAAFAVTSYTYTEEPGDLATVTLQGDVKTYGFRGGDAELVSPDARHATTQSPSVCSLSTWPEVHDLSIVSLADGHTVTRVHDDNLSFYPVRWSPDGAELLYQTYEMTMPASGCKDKLAGSERWWVVGVDRSPASGVSDPFTVMRRWYGDEYVEYRCMDKPVLDPVCIDEEHESVAVEIYVGGAPVTSSLNDSIRIIGFAPGEPVPAPTP
jgi:hypothetical protein